jgi:hypothetical protein
MYGAMPRQQQYQPRGYPAQGQQFQQAGGQWGYQATQQGYAGAAGAFQGQAYPQQAVAGAQAFPQQQQWPQQGYGQAWPQQQQMGWGQEQAQWAAQQGQWGAGPQASGAMQPVAPQQQQQPMPGKPGPGQGKRPEAGKAPPSSGEGMQPEAYQRTLEYVQQCQSWSPATGEYPVMSPDSSSKGQQKGSGSPAQDSQAMPPPAPRTAGEPSKPVQDGNMVIGDMSSSLNTLMEENRYLHLMQ